jgi:hypothetical protein
MNHPVTDPDLTPLDMLHRQQETIDNLTQSLELLQDQHEKLRRRVQVLEGIPDPASEPPEPA